MRNAWNEDRSVKPQLRSSYKLNKFGRDRHMLRRLPVIIFIVVSMLFPLSVGSEQDRGDSELQSNQESVTPASTMLYLVNPGEQFQLLWSEALKAIEHRDLQLAHEYLEELHELRVLHSVRSLDEYSIHLLKLAESTMAAGSLEEAAFFTRRALDLSPNSLPVLVEAFSLRRSLGMKTAAGQIGELFSTVLASPTVLIQLLYHLSYPMLIAFSLALLLVAFITICCQMPLLMSRFTRLFPVRLRGVLSISIFGVILFLPIFFGPLWALLSFAVIVMFLSSDRKWLVALCGVSIALWGFIVPLRENVSSWLNDPGIQTVLLVAAGNHGDQDRKELLSLLQRRSSDGLAYYVMAQLLRRHGDYNAAVKSLERAEQLMGQQPYTSAQRGMIAFLQRDIQTADSYFEQAYTQGLRSASFLYNFSRVKFDLLDTNRSRELFEAALRKDRALTQLWKEREDSLVGVEMGALAEEGLPLAYFFTSSMQPIYGVKERAENIFTILMPGFSPIMAALAGVILFLVALFRREPDLTQRNFYFERYKATRLLDLMVEILPGGSFVKAGKPVLAVVVVSTLALLTFPLLAWPLDAQVIFSVFPWLKSAYLLLWGVTLIIIYYLGFQLREEQ